MKKLLLSMGVFSMLLSVTLVACKKADLQAENSNEDRVIIQNDEKLNISSDKKMLIFKTVEDYERIVNNPSEEILTDFSSKVSKMDHTTILEKSSSNELNDEFLSKILNKDYVVQIGEYLYKVNKPAEKVFVLPASCLSEYNDLVTENKLNKNLLEFTTDQDVIALVESGKSKSLFCKEDGVGGEDKETSTCCIDNLCDDSFKGVAHYNKFGIYFSLHFSCDRISGSGFTMKIELDKVYYHVRCGNTNGPYKLFAFGSSANGFRYQSYQGSTALNQIWIKGRVIGNKTYNGKVLEVTSSWAEIRKNI